MKAFKNRLQAVLAQYDVWPWMELTQSNMQGGSLPGTQAPPFVVVAPYPMIFPEVTFIGWDQNVDGMSPIGLGNLSVGGGLYNWSVGATPDLIQQSARAVTTEQIVGAFNDRWVYMPNGQPLDLREMWQAYFTLGSAYNAGAGLMGPTTLWTGLRGYRLYKKGSMSVQGPPQLSREEAIASKKFKLVPYKYSAVANATFVPGRVGPQGTDEIIITPPGDFAADFMVHSIRISPMSPPVKASGPNPVEPGIYDYIPGVLVGVQPAQRQVTFQGGTIDQQTLSLAPWQMFYGEDWSLTAWGLSQGTPVYLPPTPRLDTQWYLPHPVTFAQNEQINFRVEAIALDGKYLNTYTMPMQLVLDGELLVQVAR